MVWEAFMDDCVFCKLISGDLPCMKVFEDEYTLAFMDVANDVEGHILVIPKKHTVSILDCNDETISCQQSGGCRSTLQRTADMKV